MPHISMCILFWHQYDGTPNKILVCGSADRKSDQKPDSKESKEPEVQTKQDQTDDNELNLLGPNDAAGLEAASDYAESFDAEQPINKGFHRYKLILAANRDEYLDRASEPLQFWNDAECDTVGGKDKKEGGTRLGVSRKNKCVSGILNKYTKKRDDGPKSSRGKLCVDNLKSHSEFANKIRNKNL